MILNDRQLRELWESARESDPSVVKASASFSRVKQVYDAVKYDKVHAGKDDKWYASLVDDITEQLAMGNTIVGVITKEGDLKHLSYFDQFMYKGATKDILDVIRKYGTPKELFKGLRMKKPRLGDTDTQKFNVGDWSVEQDIEVDDEGYAYITGFLITYEGVPVFSYGNVRTQFVKSYKVQRYAEEGIQYYTKTYTNKQGVTKTREIRRDANGRFAKKAAWDR